MQINELDKDLEKIKKKTPELFSEVFQVSVPMHLFYKKLLGNAEDILKINHGISSIELDVLSCLYYSGGNDYILTPTQLSSRLLFSVSSLSKLVKRLEILGYLIRIANQDDKRSNLVKLTKEGEQIILKSSLNVKESDENCFKGLNKDDLNELKRILVKAIENNDMFMSKIKA